MKKQKNDYPKILNTPIDMREAAHIMPEIERARFNELYDQKLDALFNHFQLDRKKKTDWQILVLYLAEKHVKGFQTIEVGRTVGRKKTRNLISDMNLIEKVEDKAKEKNNDISWACKQLTRTDEYSNYKASALETWFYDAKRRHPYYAKIIAHKRKTGVQYSYLIALSFMTDLPDRVTPMSTKIK